jgi:hypothetical protein
MSLIYRVLASWKIIYRGRLRMPMVFLFAYFLTFFWHLGRDYLVCWQGLVA